MNPLRRLVFSAFLGSSLLAPIGAQDATPASGAGADPMAGVAIDKVSYFIGRSIGRQLAGDGFRPDFAALQAGIEDAMGKKESKYPEAELRQAMERFQTAMQAAAGQRGAAAVKAGEAFLAENGKRKGVTTTASGLQYEVLSTVEGPKPAATDTVKVHYRGTLLNGTEFDSSYARNEPTSFPLNRVIPGWTEGLQLMPKGSKFKFFIPSGLAYGPNGSPPSIGPNETLVFEVELLDIVGKQ
jgi:FKBP-type peptidyl-prolyl cis-trans isomerase FkpA/FKBP-type peptidyl-prolyl cis-trans isomerase FklB